MGPTLTPGTNGFLQGALKKKVKRKMAGRLMVGGSVNSMKKIKTDMYDKPNTNVPNA